MSNMEWKNGYDQGFAAGWKAAKADKDLNYQNYPQVYYAGGPTGAVGSFSTTMADTLSIVSASSGNDYSPGGGYNSYKPPTVNLTESKTEKQIRNLTDHTRIV